MFISFAAVTTFYAAISAVAKALAEQGIGENRCA